jgi:hypothetical protein
VSPAELYAAFDDVPHSETQEPPISSSPADAKPSVCSIVPSEGSMHALSTTFTNVTDSNSVPRAPVNSVSVQQEAMSISNALPHIQLKVGSSGSDSLLEGMFDSGAGLNVGSHAYLEAVMKKNPHLVTGIHRFEDLNTPPIGLVGITLDGVAPRVTAVISYKMPYMSNGSPCLLKIALAKGFSIRTIFWTPFQRKAKLAYMPHLGLVVINLWWISFPVAFKKLDRIECSPAHGPAAVLLMVPVE